MHPLIRRSQARPAHPWLHTRRHPADWPGLGCRRDEPAIAAGVLYTSPS